MQSIASQEKISGYNLANLIIQKLDEEGLSVQPVVKKNRVFFGCRTENIVISKRDKSWKTVKLTCKNNKLWNYSFRNKIPTSDQFEKSEGLKKKSERSIPKNNTKTVFVLRHSKLKGERIEESDLVLSEEKKIISKGAFSDLRLVLGKQLKRGLRKGAILKESHLNPDWLVYKNQRIIIEHSIGEISVKMEGIALSNGAKGERILAKNISSNKIIEGFVKGTKKISVFNKIN